MRRLAGVLAALALSTLAVGQEAQQERPQVPFYRVETRLVAIPVYVTDAEGNPVLGLSAADFHVREGRRGCRIEAVEFIDHRNPSPDVFSISPPESRRQFLILVDLSFSNVGGLREASDAAIHFLLNNAMPTDLVAVLTLSQRGGVDLLCPFSTQRSQALYALANLGLSDLLRYRDPAGFAFDSNLEQIESELAESIELDSDSRRSQQSEAALESMGDIFRLTKSMDDSRYAGVVTRYIRVLESLATGLQQLHGRKNVVLFSEGFDQQVLVGMSLDELEQEQLAMSTLQTGQEGAITANMSSRFGSVALQRLFASVLEEFSRANAVFYVVDVGRLAAGEEEYQSRARGQNTLFMFADETNGILYRNINDLEVALDDIAQRTSAGYLVLFEPSQEGRAGEFREVRIEVNRPGLRVNHQEGYYFDREYREFSPQEKMIQLAEYVSKDLISQRIPFEFGVQVFPGDEGLARVPVVVEIEGGGLLDTREPRQNESIEIEIYGYLLDEQNRPLDFFYDTLAIPAGQAAERLRIGGIKYYGQLVAAPGRFKVKCIVRDCELGMISSAIQLVTVPYYGQEALQLSGPIFLEASDDWINVYNPASLQATDRREGQPVEYPFIWGGNRWLPALNPAVDPSQSRLLYVSAHGLMQHPTARVPQVEMRFETIDSASEVRVLHQVFLADRREDPEAGSYDLLFQVNLSEQNLAPGQCRLRFILTDTLAHDTTVSEVPFTIPEQ